MGLCVGTTGRSAGATGIDVGVTGIGPDRTKGELAEQVYPNEAETPVPIPLPDPVTKAVPSYMAVKFCPQHNPSPYLS
jgi:hypothetical protein